MKQLKFEINRRIDLYLNKVSFKSTIQNLTDEYIAIGIPMFQGQYVPLSKGQAEEFHYYDDKGGVYSFESSVLGRIREGNVAQIYISYPQKYRKIQRRDFVRINLYENIKYCKIEKSNTELLESKFKKAIAIDLSGGGMKIKADEELKFNDKIFVVMENKDFTVKSEGKIVRTYKDEEGSFIYGVAFQDMGSSERENIIKNVFNLMRKQRKVALKED